MLREGAVRMLALSVLEIAAPAAAQTSQELLDTASAVAIQKIEFLHPKVTGVAKAECPIELYPGDVIKP